MSKSIIIKMSGKEKSPPRNIIAKEMIDRFNSGGPMRDRRERRPKDKRTWLADYQQDEGLPKENGADLDPSEASETMASEGVEDEAFDFWEWFGKDPCPNFGMLAEHISLDKLKKK